MWVGGVRVVVPDDKGRILLVRQHHENRDIWMLPGGGIEEGENAAEAAAREVLEETGVSVEVRRLIWHVEEVSPERGQRFVNFFLAEILEGEAVLGQDPEFDAEHQVLRELAFFSKEEVMGLPNVYPEILRDEIWAVLDGKPGEPVFRLR